jgi:hypothetical protein
MLCTILKPFAFSSDGIHAEQAVVGRDMDIPDEFITGLENEGYVATCVIGKAISGAPENKMLTGADENKAPAEVGERPDDADPGEHIGGFEPEYEARETSRGWYAVFRDDEEVEAIKKMRQADAEAFNAMTPDERAEYIAAELADA